MFILDSHCDTPSQLLRGRDIALDNPYSHVDFPKLKRGGVDAVFFALFTPNTITADEATVRALRMLARVHDSLDASANVAALATSPSEIATNRSRGLISVLLGMENGLPLQEDISLLRLFYRQGVRYLTLTHNGDNAICDSAAEGRRWGGLSPFGREVVAEMNRLGMIVDVAHLSDATFWDCVECSSAPIVSTHSCCRALASHRRNMTDEMIRSLADKGGVIQINFYPRFLSDKYAEAADATGLEDWAEAIEAEWIADPSNPSGIKSWQDAQDRLKTLPRPGVKEIVDHIDHAVMIGGIDAVGIGSDFDGILVPPEGVEDCSAIPAVFDEMARRGYSEAEIEKVAGLNFLRVMTEVLK